MREISRTASVTNTPCWLPERVTLLKSQGDGSFLNQIFSPAMRKLTISSSSRPLWQLNREQNAYLSCLMMLLHYYNQKELNIPIFMESSVHRRQTTDITATAKEHANLLPNLLAAHGLSGCDTVTPCYGIGKMKILKTLKQGNHSLSCLGDSNANWPDVVKQATSSMLACYGVPKLNSMTQARANQWKTRVGRGSSTMPKLCSLPPTDPAFMENWKGHISRYAYGNMRSISMSLTSILYNMGGLRIKPLKVSMQFMCPQILTLPSVTFKSL